jgi:hypothetical protein
VVVRTLTQIGSTIFAVVGISTNSFAHLGHGIAGGERRIELLLGERDVAISYSLGLAAGETQTELEAAHERGEENARLDQLTSELTKHVKVCVGRTPDQCRPLSKKELTSVAASGWKTDTLTLEWRFQLPLSENTLRLEDSWTLDEIARTDVAIRPHSTRPPLRAGPDEPQKVELEFAFDDRLLAGAPRVIGVELPPRPGIGVWPVALGLSLVVIVGLLFFVVRRKKRALRSSP